MIAELRQLASLIARLIATFTLASIFFISVEGIPHPGSMTALLRSSVSPSSQTAQAGGGGTTYYLSPTGDDANPGTIDQPWKNFERPFDTSAGDHLRGGDTLYLRSGTYRYDEGKNVPPRLIPDNTINGTPGSPTLISSYPGEHASIYLSARIDSGWLEYADRPGVWYFDWNAYMTAEHPWLLTHSGYGGNSRYTSGLMIPDLVAIDGSSPTLLQEVASNKNAQNSDSIRSLRNDQDDMIAGDFYFDAEPTDEHYGQLFVWLPDGSEPNGKPIEVSLDNGITVSNQQNLSVSNLSVRYGSVGGINISGSNIIVDSIDSSYNAFFGLIGQCSSCTVLNSSFSHNGDEGSGFEGVDVTYRNNLFDGNNYRHYSSNYHCGGMKLTSSAKHMTFTGNTFKDTIDCGGLWLDGSPGGKVIEKNTFVSTIGDDKSPLVIEVSDGTASDPIIVRNNIFVNTWTYISASSYVYVFNNLFKRSWVAAGNIDANNPDRLRVSNNRVFNNIFYMPPTTAPPPPIYFTLNAPAPIDASNNTSDNNLFYTLSPPFPQFGPEIGSGTRLSLTEWKSRGFDAHSLLTNPLLGNIDAGNYAPQNDSPVVGAGLVTPYVTDDINGNPRNGRNDIGPYQSSVVTFQPNPNVLPPVIPDPLLPPVIPPVVPPVVPQVPSPQLPVTYSATHYVPINRANPLLPTQIRRNLKQGDTGEDVRLLQQQLNRDGFLVATSGPQSIGKETTAFNAAVKAALLRYQQSLKDSGIIATGMLDNATLTLIDAELVKYYRELDAIAAEASTTAQQSRGSIILNWIGDFIWKVVAYVVDGIGIAVDRIRGM